MRFSTLLSLLASAVLAASEVTEAKLNTLLSQRRLWTSPNTQILFPFSPEWNNVTLRWTIYDAPVFKAAIRPGNEADLQTVVKLAGTFRIPLLVTGGKHGFGFENDFRGLAVDMGHFKSVDVDADANTLTVGGSVQFSDILDPLHAAGKEIQTGSCICAGMIGVTLGGGVGRYQGMHGLIIDDLISVRLVTAKGDLITVSADSHPDLFWGLRGGGHNFGIVTSATFRISDLSNGGNPVMSADFMFPASANASYFDVLSTFDGNLPPELSLITVLRYDAEAGAAGILSNFVYAGPEEKGRELIQPFLDLGPSVENIYTVPFNELAPAAGFGLNSIFCVPGNVLSVYGANIRSFSASTWKESFGKLAALYETTPATRLSTVDIEMFPNQAVLAVPNEDTAYPWRDAIANILIQMNWNDDAAEEPANALARELRNDIALTSGYPELSVYNNYGHGDESLEQLYGESGLGRLAQLKKTWDPKDMFSFYHPVPKSYP